MVGQWGRSVSKTVAFRKCDLISALGWAKLLSRTNVRTWSGTLKFKPNRDFGFWIGFVIGY